MARQNPPPPPVQIRRGMNLGPMMEPTLITKTMGLIGKKTAFHASRLFLMLKEMEGFDRREDPLYMISMVSLCVNNSLRSTVDKDTALLVQASACGFPDTDIPTAQETLTYLQEQVRARWIDIGAQGQGYMTEPGGTEPPVSITQAVQAGQEVPNVSLADVHWMALGISKIPGYDVLAMQVTTSAIMMYTRQGNITTNVIDKVVAAVREQTNIILSFDKQVIRTAWASISPHMNAEKAKTLIRMWENSVGESCLRIRLLLQQSNWNSMTNYNNINEAKRKYPTFPWDKLAAIIPEDMTNYITAVRAVNGDEYYGYNTDLGEAKSTKYPQLAYAAYQLLCEVGGDLNLRDFKGVNMRIENRGIIDDLIRDWRTQRDRERKDAPVCEEDRNTAARFLALEPLNVGGGNVQNIVAPIVNDQNRGGPLDPPGGPAPVPLGMPGAGPNAPTLEEHLRQYLYGRRA